MNERLSLTKKKTFFSYITESVAEIAYGAALVLICIQVINGDLAVGAFTYLSSAILSFSQVLERIVRMFERAYSMGATKEDMIQMLNSIPDEVDEKKLESDENAECAYELKNVSFGYFPDKPVLQNISMKIGHGELVALVGPNGCGKSTLVNILLGLLEPDIGEAYFEGHPVSEVSLNQRRYLQSAVFQDYVCYHFSLRDNVGFGDLDLLYDDERLRDAVIKGGCAELLDNGQGLDVALSREFDDHGIELSGGQWQRIAISRALLGDHKYIFFDEPAASIDPLAERKQFEQIRSSLHGKSGVLVTHRIGIAQLADRIIYMEDGQIRETGTHQELMKQNGGYATMYRTQARWYTE